MTKEFTELVEKLKKMCTKERAEFNLWIYFRESDFNCHFPFSENPTKERKWLLPVYHLTNGLWYGYPVCCVLFFVYHHLKGDMVEINKKRPNDDLEYVKCNKCFKK